MREDLFQKIWENYSPEFTELRTTHGDYVRLLHPGTLNHGDGPDFEHASVIYQGIQWHGSIELHINCNDWYTHRHQSDTRYNKVILHVVLDRNHARPVTRQDGTLIPTVVLHEYIPQNILSVVRRTRKHHELACSNIIHHITPDVIHHQFEIASRLYLNDKIKRVRNWYDPSRKPSEAWIHMVWMSWCDGLGIPKNRTMMTTLCQRFLELHTDDNTPSDIRNRLYAMSGLSDTWQNPGQEINFENQSGTVRHASIHQHPHSSTAHQLWDFSGSRPGNNPTVRIRQAANLLASLKTTGFRYFTKADLPQLIRFFSNPQFSGQVRRSILLAISVIPSIHMLAEILGKYELQHQVEQYWFEQGFSPPGFITQFFTDANIELDLPKQGPGITSQFKNYCRKKACSECLIFKSAVGG